MLAGAVLAVLVATFFAVAGGFVMAAAAFGAGDFFAGVFFAGVVVAAAFFVAARFAGAFFFGAGSAAAVPVTRFAAATVRPASVRAVVRAMEPAPPFFVALSRQGTCDPSGARPHACRENMPHPDR